MALDQIDDAFVQFGEPAGEEALPGEADDAALDEAPKPGFPLPSYSTTP